MRAKAAKAAAAGVIAATTLLIAAVAWAAVESGKYVGTTSERGTITFEVPAAATIIAGFSTTDGYNGKCKFQGGTGGIPNFSVSIASMKIGPGGAFTAATKAKLGPFSATIIVKGRLTPTGATGTLNRLGASCGSGAANPSTSDYLETFSARRTSN